MHEGRTGSWLRALAVSALTLAGCKDKVQTTAPEFRGTRGESCLVTNDCKKGLLCVAQTCVAEDVPLAPTGKVCITAECINSADCCPPQTKSQAENCTQWKADCAQGDSFSCTEYQAQCGACKAKCTDHQCTTPQATSSDCQTSSDCGFSLVCSSGRCVECGSDSDCPTGNICETGQCLVGCTKDEACGVMAKCSAGRCEKRGCISDYECAAFLGVGDAVCKDTKCTVSCEHDGQCAALGAGGLSVCAKGQCVFVGCKENADCAALFASENGSSNVGVTSGQLAVCVDAPK